MAPKPFASGHILAAADVNDLVGVINRSTTEVDVVSTTSETTIYSHSVPANAMSTDRMLRLTIIGDYLDNSGAPRNPTIFFKFGGTLLIGAVNGTNLNSGTRAPMRMVWEIANLNSASVQQSSGIVTIGNQSTLSHAGVGYNSGTGAAGIDLRFGSAGTSAINTASAQTILVSVVLDVANASYSFRKKYALLELL